MPKKTKREKIISQYRKRLKLLELLQETPKQIPTDQEPEKIVVEIESARPDNDLQLRKFFVSDLKKSLSFVAAIIALEIIIYFGTINKYFSFK